MHTCSIMGLSNEMQEVDRTNPFLACLWGGSPMEYIVPSLRIATLIGMMDHGVVEERIMQLDELKE